MTRGVFYCYEVPTANLAEIEWLVEKPIRDWELEADVGKPVWMVKYDANHPSMQKINRLDTCKECRFGGIVFDDDSEQVINFRPILAGALFGPLRDQATFDQVRIDPEVHTLVWPNGADFDPATLHDWPKHESALTARAAQWDLSPT